MRLRKALGPLCISCSVLLLFTGWISQFSSWIHCFFKMLFLLNYSFFESSLQKPWKISLITLFFYFFRSTSTTSALAQQQLLLSNSGNTSDSMTMSTTASALARAFGIVVRTIADLLSLLQDYGPLTPPLNRMLDISYNEAIRYDFFKIHF